MPHGGVKIALAHQFRGMPPVQRAIRDVRAGKYGKLLRMYARPKDDHRGGGEELTVHGTHLFDMMIAFAGRPRWVSGHIAVGHRNATERDRREGNEPVGPIAGDSIAATFGFSSGVHGFFHSHGQYGSSRSIAVRLADRSVRRLCCMSAAWVMCTSTRHPSFCRRSPICPAENMDRKVAFHSRAQATRHERLACPRQPLSRSSTHQGNRGGSRAYRKRGETPCSSWRWFKECMHLTSTTDSESRSRRPSGGTP